MSAKGFRRRRIIPGAPPGTLNVEPGAPQPRMHVLAYGPDDLLDDAIDGVDAVRDPLQRFSVTWLNIHGIGNAETLEGVARIFDMHPLALEDVVNVPQRPKAETYGEHLFVVARVPARTETLHTEQFSIYFGKGFVATFQEAEGDCFESVRKRIRDGRPRIRGNGPDYLTYALLDAIVDSYFPWLEKFGDRLEELEQKILESPAPEDVPRLHELKRDLLHLRRHVWPLREVLSGLVREESELVTDSTKTYLRDCYDHTIQIMELVESYRDVASGLMDLYLSSLSNKMNDVMKTLTIIATIFIPLSFVVGLYGMNFDRDASRWNMPELGWAFGYPFVLGIMAAVAVTMLLWFRRRGWL